MKIFWAFLVCLLVAACVHSQNFWRGPASSSQNLRVIALTDFHGALESTSKKVGTVTYEAGGAPWISGFIQTLQKIDDTPTLIVDAGDLFQGTLVSNYFEGKSVIEFYRYLGVRAAAVGNHDFDYGPLGRDRSVPLDKSDDPRGAFKHLIKFARTTDKYPVPLLFYGANIVGQQSSPEESWGSSDLLQVQGLKVGVIGLAAVETPQTTNPRNLTGLQFTDLKAAILRHAVRLRQQQGADFVVVTVHSGAACNDNSFASLQDLSSCEPGSFLPLIAELPEGLVDVVVGGHTHKGVFKKIKSTYVMQPFSRGQYVASLTLGQDLKTRRDGLLPVCSKWLKNSAEPLCPDAATMPAGTQLKLESPRIENILVTRDAKVDTILEPYLAAARELANRNLRVQAPRAFIKDYRNENDLGNLFADLLHKKHSEYDLVVLNNGGFRADLPAGNLTYNHIYQIFPFDNFLAVLTVDGKALKRIVRIGVSDLDGGLSWSKNLKLRSRFQDGECDVQVSVNGKEVQDKDTFKILTTDFVADGGVGFHLLNLPSTAIRFLKNQPNLRDSAVEALQAHPGYLRSFKATPPRQERQGVCPQNSV